MHTTYIHRGWCWCLLIVVHCLLRLTLPPFSGRSCGAVGLLTVCKILAACPQGVRVHHGRGVSWGAVGICCVYSACIWMLSLLTAWSHSNEPPGHHNVYQYQYHMYLRIHVDIVNTIMCFSITTSQGIEGTHIRTYVCTYAPFKVTFYILHLWYSDVYQSDHWCCRGSQLSWTDTDSELMSNNTTVNSIH